MDIPNPSGNRALGSTVSTEGKPPSSRLALENIQNIDALNLKEGKAYSGVVREALQAASGKEITPPNLSEDPNSQPNARGNSQTSKQPNQKNNTAQSNNWLLEIQSKLILLETNIPLKAGQIVSVKLTTNGELILVDKPGNTQLVSTRLLESINQLIARQVSLSTGLKQLTQRLDTPLSKLNTSEIGIAQNAWQTLLDSLPKQRDLLAALKNSNEISPKAPPINSQTEPLLTVGAPMSRNDALTPSTFIKNWLNQSGLTYEALLTQRLQTINQTNNASRSNTEALVKSANKNEPQIARPQFNNALREQLTANVQQLQLALALGQITPLTTDATLNKSFTISSPTLNQPTNQTSNLMPNQASTENQQAKNATTEILRQAIQTLAYVNKNNSNSVPPNTASTDHTGASIKGDQQILLQQNDLLQQLLSRYFKTTNTNQSQKIIQAIGEQIASLNQQNQNNSGSDTRSTLLNKGSSATETQKIVQDLMQTLNETLLKNAPRNTKPVYLDNLLNQFQLYSIQSNAHDASLNTVDLKQRLLTLIHSLQALDNKSHLARHGGSSSTPAAATQPNPTTNALSETKLLQEPFAFPHLQNEAITKASAQLADVELSTGQVLKLLAAMLNRIQFNQLNSLYQSQTGAAEPGIQQSWFFELPILLDNHQAQVFNLRIDQKQNQNKTKSAQAQLENEWQIALAFDFPKLGSIYIQANLKPPALTTKIWATQNHALKLIERETRHLRQQLDKLNLDIGDIDCMLGQPKMNRAKIVRNLVDTRA